MPPIPAWQCAPQRHTSRSVVGESILITTVCRAWREGGARCSALRLPALRPPPQAAAQEGGEAARPKRVLVFAARALNSVGWCEAAPSRRQEGI